MRNGWDECVIKVNDLVSGREPKVIDLPLNYFPRYFQQKLEGSPGTSGVSWAGTIARPQLHNRGFEGFESVPHIRTSFDKWFNDTYVKEWEEKNDTEVTVDPITIGINERAVAEVKAQEELS